MPKELNLNNTTKEVLVVKIGDKEYSVPLATSLPFKKAKELIKLAFPVINVLIIKDTPIPVSAKAITRISFVAKTEKESTYSFSFFKFPTNAFFA